MSFNAQKIANIIHDECESTKVRCNGYRAKLVDVIIRIITAEKSNLIKRGNIQQQINDICSEAGDFLAQNQHKNMKGNIQ